MIGNLNNVEIDNFLNENVVGRIGCSMDGRPYIVPITYAYDGKFVYAHSSEGKKLEMMRNNPNVCFEVDNTTDLANWKSVIAWGSFEELTDETERKKGLELLMNKEFPVNSSVTLRLGSQWPFYSNEDLATNEIDGVVFRIQLAEKSGRYESNHLSPKMAG